MSQRDVAAPSPLQPAPPSRPGGGARPSGHWLFPGILLWLGIGWGATQPLGKIATQGGAGPLALTFWQAVIGTVTLGALTLLRGRGLVFTRPALVFYAVVAALGTVLPGLTFYTSVERLPSGIMSIIISTIPLMAFPLALILGMERFDRVRFLGLVLGLAAVALIALPGTSLPDRGMIAFLPLALCGPLLYALEATFVARYGTAGMDAVQAMFGVSLVAALLTLPMMLVTGQGRVPWPVGRAEAALILSSALHGLLYATYVWLAARAGSVFAAHSSYLVTAAGMIWAMLLLGERPSVTVWLAVVVMLAGVALVQSRQPQSREVEV
ncbi:DMT family transporter [Rhodobacter calidifons]|uniref:DMT family transporter n=1 Tax=Rhodobacter calidifons TaxID=2715277 RepID=A0ABX0G4I0_9RHOB|nr:DMT family transporter [Rhodobacter calidifons]NHB76127.1 DMT family transporter [Rhodobacter calidifons]